MEKDLFLTLSYYAPPKHNNSNWSFFRQKTFRQKPFAALQQNTRLGILWFTRDGTATDLILLFLWQDSNTDQRILEEVLDPHSRELFTCFFKISSQVTSRKGQVSEDSHEGECRFNQRLLLSKLLKSKIPPLTPSFLL